VKIFWYLLCTNGSKHVRTNTRKVMIKILQGSAVTRTVLSGITTLSFNRSFV